ncbi:unnamed protein product, partial [Protopolystoma xenopodis]
MNCRFFSHFPVGISHPVAVFLTEALVNVLPPCLFKVFFKNILLGLPAQPSGDSEPQKINRRLEKMNSDDPLFREVALRFIYMAAHPYASRVVRAVILRLHKPDLATVLRMFSMEVFPPVSLVTTTAVMLPCDSGCVNEESVMGLKLVFIN